MRSDDLPIVAWIDKVSFSLPWSQRAYAQELENGPLADLWVAEQRTEDGVEFLGSIVTWVILDLAHVVTISVHPNLRRRGVASELLEHGLAHVHQRGAQQATLEVRASNTAAQALYARFGFEVAGRRHKYYLDNHEDALIMSVRLD